MKKNLTAIGDMFLDIQAGKIKLPEGGDVYTYIAGQFGMERQAVKNLLFAFPQTIERLAK
jgi:hypothetical protein